MRAAFLTTLLASATATAAEPPVLVLIVRPPLAASALAEVLRVYLDGYAIEVASAATDAAAPSLRDDLRDARSAGEARRAVAVVRLVEAEGRVEVQLVDRLGDKALVTSLVRPSRDEDLYRTVALKVESLLRSALYEEASTPAVLSQPVLLRTVAQPPPPPRDRVGIEVGYTVMVLPHHRLVGQGLTAGVAVRVLGPLVLVAAGSMLTDFSAVAGDVAVAQRATPLWVAARFVLRRARLELSAEAEIGITLTRIAAASASSQVAPSATYVDPTLGVGGAAALRLVGPVFARVRAAGTVFLTEEQLLVRGEPVLGLGRFGFTLEAGIAVGLM